MSNIDYSKIGPVLEKTVQDLKQENKTLLEQDRKHKVQRDILQEQLNSLGDLKNDRENLKHSTVCLKEKIAELESENRHYFQMKRDFNRQSETIEKLENKLELAKEMVLLFFDS